MNMINIYISLKEISEYIESKLSKEDKEKFKDCTWYPIVINNNLTDIGINVTVCPIKN